MPTVFYKYQKFEERPYEQRQVLWFYTGVGYFIGFLNALILFIVLK